MDDAGIRSVNRRYLACSDATDVIAFRFDTLPGEDTDFSAEIFVNVERAVHVGWRQPKGRKISPLTVHANRYSLGNPSRELALYIAHGCDHVGGGTDGDRAGRTRMRRRELRWLKHVSIADLVDELIS